MPFRSTRTLYGGPNPDTLSVGPSTAPAFAGSSSPTMECRAYSSALHGSVDATCPRVTRRRFISNLKDHSARTWPTTSRQHCKPTLARRSSSTASPSSTAGGTCGGSTRRSAAPSCDKNESPRWFSSLRPGSRTTTTSEGSTQAAVSFRAVSASVRDARACRSERTVMPHRGIKWTPAQALSGRATCSCPLSTSQRTASSTAS